MKVYEYKNGKVSVKRAYDYTGKRSNFIVLKDIHNLFLSISLISIILSVIVALSVISVVFENGSVMLSLFIDVISGIFSFIIIYLSFEKYKKDLSKQNN